jgi:hypothetical protein
MTKRMLLIKASNDVCATEISHIEKICEMFSIAHEVVELTSLENFASDVRALGRFDFLYLGAHANQHSFGESDGSTSFGWGHFAGWLCATDCLKSESVLLLGCCRGGLKMVAMAMFIACGKIDYIVGPRWTVTPQDITTAFHVFLYNLAIRREQPSTAATRSSQATGYDLYYYDRVEIEDSVNSESMVDHIVKSWGLESESSTT